MNKEILYKGNKIAVFPHNDVIAFILNKDGDIESNSFNSLEKAKKWIDNNRKQEE